VISLSIKLPDTHKKLMRYSRLFINSNKNKLCEESRVLNRPSFCNKINIFMNSEPQLNENEYIFAIQTYANSAGKKAPPCLFVEFESLRDRNELQKLKHY